MAVGTLLAPSGKAALTFSASQAIVAPGDPVNVAISVQGFNGVLAMQGSIAWDTSLLTYVSVDNFASGLSGLNETSFGFRDDHLTYSWNDSEDMGVSIPDETVLFTIQLAAGSSPGSTMITFDDSPLTSWAADQDLNKTYFAVDALPGSVTVVPEPVSSALGIFGGLAVCVQVVRWLSRAKHRRGNCGCG